MVRHSLKSPWKKKSISIQRQMISCTCRRCAAGVHTGSRGGQPLTQKVWNGREIGCLTVLKNLEEFLFFLTVLIPESRRQEVSLRAVLLQMDLLYATFMPCQQNGKSRKIYSTSSVWCRVQYAVSVQLQQLPAVSWNKGDESCEIEPKQLWALKLKQRADRG